MNDRASQTVTWLLAKPRCWWARHQGVYGGGPHAARTAEAVCSSSRVRRPASEGRRAKLPTRNGETRVTSAADGGSSWPFFPLNCSRLSFAAQVQAVEPGAAESAPLKP